MHNRTALKAGFTLVEVLVTVAVMAVVMLGLLQLVTFNFKAQQGVQDSSDLNGFGNSLQQILGVNAGCTANLAGTVPVQFTVPGSYPSGPQYNAPGGGGTPILQEIDYTMPSAGGLNAN